MTSYSIVKASLPEHFTHARRLFEDYQRWLGIDLCFQNFSQELNALAEMYGPPAGALLLARIGEDYVGCVGLRNLGERRAEMKRMYVVESSRGRGVGFALAEACITSARSLGYEAIRLDTVPRLKAALAIYRKLGFVETPAYRHNPDPGAIFLELSLIA